MNWKLSKNKIESGGLEETDFILGLDIGNNTSAIAYFDINRLTPEIIDLSGGYGKPSTPTVVQYIPESSEWIFGEYAVLNKGFGNELTISSMLERLGTKEYIEVDKKAISFTHILSLYVKELISSCYAINPKADIAGIVLAVPEYLSEEAKEELTLIFNAAGYGKAVIEFVSDKECVLSRYFFNRDIKKEQVVILDFGSREFRGGIYEVVPSSGNIGAKCLSTLLDKTLGTDVVDNVVKQLFTKLYKEEESKVGGHPEDLLHVFAYQHKDLLFQKNIFTKPIKLYYNFAYPPFQKHVTADDVESLVAPFKNKLKDFIEQLFKRTSGRANYETVTTVICTGGGFEMLWIREEINRLFPKANIEISKNAKGGVAEGACTIAAAKLGAIKRKSFEIEDSNQINVDIGVNVRSGRNERFIPLVERNSFWWQSHTPKTLILYEEAPKAVELFKRDRSGEVFLLGKLPIDDLPKRPKGATKIKLGIKFNDHGSFKATVKDLGFGELFAAGDYEREFEVKLSELGKL